MNDGTTRTVTSQGSFRPRSELRPQHSSLSPMPMGYELNQRLARELVYQLLLMAIVNCAIEPGASLSEKSIPKRTGSAVRQSVMHCSNWPRKAV